MPRPCCVRADALRPRCIVLRYTAAAEPHLGARAPADTSSLVSSGRGSPTCTFQTWRRLPRSRARAPRGARHDDGIHEQLRELRRVEPPGGGAGVVFAPVHASADGAPARWPDCTSQAAAERGRAQPQQNARFWLAQFSPQPLPDDSEVPFTRLIANGALLSRVGAALVMATQQGLATVPAVNLRDGDAWAAPVGAARAGRAADDAAAFVAACRTMGVRTVECCSALDVTHPGASSTKAVRGRAPRERKREERGACAHMRMLPPLPASPGVRHSARAVASLQGARPARRAVSRRRPVVPERRDAVRRAAAGRQAVRPP